MGNQLLKSYEVDEESKFESGPYIGWSILQARHTERKDFYTIFLFSKPHVEDGLKQKLESFIQILRADALYLRKLRHPNILAIAEPLLEDKNSLAFVTRPTKMTLYGLMKTSELSVLELQCGFLDICEALLFLHEDAKMAHLSLHPGSIFISPSGKWLLGGMGHCVNMATDNMTMSTINFESLGYSSKGQSFSCSPPLQYMPPEMVSYHDRRCGFPSDIFSLGLVFYEALNSNHQPLIQTKGNNISSYESQIRTMLPLKKGLLKTEVYEILFQMLSFDYRKRPTIEQVLRSQLFQNINIKALRFVESLREKDDGQRVQFLRGLMKLVEEQPALNDQRILRNRILLPLLDFLTDLDLGPYLLPTIFVCIKKACPESMFVTEVWPKMRTLLTAKEIRIQTVLQLIQELELILSLSTDKIVQSDISPFILKCLQLPDDDIQDNLLRQIPLVVKRLDYTVLRSSVCPMILGIITDTSISSVRVGGLNSLGDICASFDRTTVVEQIIPTIEKVVKKDRSPSVCSAVRATIETLSQRLGHKVTAEKLIPLLTQILVAESIAQDQFEATLQAVNALLQRVKEIRMKEFSIKSVNTANVDEALRAPEVSLEALLKDNSFNVKDTPTDIFDSTSVFPPAPNKVHGSEYWKTSTAVVSNTAMPPSNDLMFDDLLSKVVFHNKSESTAAGQQLQFQVSAPTIPARATGNTDIFDFSKYLTSVDHTSKITSCQQSHMTTAELFKNTPAIGNTSWGVPTPSMPVSSHISTVPPQTNVNRQFYSAAAPSMPTSKSLSPSCAKTQRGNASNCTDFFTLDVDPFSVSQPMSGAAIDKQFAALPNYSVNTTNQFNSMTSSAFSNPIINNIRDSSRQLPNNIGMPSKNNTNTDAFGDLKELHRVFL